MAALDDIYGLSGHSLPNSIATALDPPIAVPGQSADRHLPTQVKAGSGPKWSKLSRSAFALTGAAQTVRQFACERLRLPHVARLQVCRGYLRPEIAVLDHARLEITHQRQHRADRTSCGDEMNAVDEFAAVFDAQRLYGRQVAFPIAVANHNGGKLFADENRPSELGLHE